jgi:hypothetical protein
LTSEVKEPSGSFVTLQKIKSITKQKKVSDARFGLSIFKTQADEGFTRRIPEGGKLKICFSRVMTD